MPFIRVKETKMEMMNGCYGTFIKHRCLRIFFLEHKI